jgi:hypothetical protein
MSNKPDDTIIPTKIYESLYTALQQSAKEEIALDDVFKRKLTNNNELHKKRMNELTQTALPQHMGQLIGTLELHTPFLSLGRYIRSFNDAEFVIRNLKTPIITGLKGKEIADIPAINLLIQTSIEVCDIADALRPTFKN